MGRGTSSVLHFFELTRGNVQSWIGDGAVSLLFQQRFATAVEKSHLSGRNQDD